MKGRRLIRQTRPTRGPSDVQYQGADPRRRMTPTAVEGWFAALTRSSAGATDADLLGRFAAGRDGAAFAELVRRHGPLVLGVCRRGVPDAHLAEDAFQAVFVVLATNAGRVDPARPLGPSPVPGLGRIPAQLHLDLRHDAFPGGRDGGAHHRRPGQSQVDHRDRLE